MHIKLFFLSAQDSNHKTISFASLHSSDTAAVTTDVHSKLAGPAQDLVIEMKAYLLGVWIKLVKSVFKDDFPRLSARVVEEVSCSNTHLL